MLKVWIWYRTSGCWVDMSWKMGHSTWSCLWILCWDPPNVYLCFVWSQIKKSITGRSCFDGDVAAHCGRQRAHQFYLWYDWYIIFTFWHWKYICLMQTSQTMCHTNSWYWWRYIKWHPVSTHAYDVPCNCTHMNCNYQPSEKNHPLQSLPFLTLIAFNNKLVSIYAQGMVEWQLQDIYNL